MRTAIDTSIFKSYDIRGIFPSQLNDDVAYAIGRAFVEVLGRKNICIGRDMRPSGEALFMDALSRGATDAGADVTAGRLDLDRCDLLRRRPIRLRRRRS